MKYMMMIYADGADWQNFTPEQRKVAMQAWMDFRNAVVAAGVLVSNETLYPVSDATSVRVRDGKTLIADGPFAETHEQLGGYFVLDCKDLDDALAWAAQMPGAQYGTVEVRPVVAMNFDR